jgi:hypothetical protein
MTKIIRTTSQRAKPFNLRPMSAFEERDIEWIWYPYLARGELTIIEGDPEAKKSFMIQAVARRLVDGFKLPSKWPDLQAKPGKVVFFDTENDAETVLKKRFRHLRLREEGSIYVEHIPFEMSEKNIDDILIELNHIRPLMVVFDTMNDYFDREANTSIGRDVAQALQPFKKMAKELNCAVVLVRHLTKGTGKAMYRGSGSITFAGKARIVIAVAPHPEIEDVTCMALTKSSNAPKPKALTYHVENRATPEDRSAFRFQWGEEVNLSAEDILNPQNPPGRPPKERDDAEDWLREQLRKGPVAVKRLEEQAERRGISWSTIRRASDDIGVVKPKGGRNSEWRLP